MTWFIKLALISTLLLIHQISCITEEDEGVKYANNCEGTYGILKLNC